MKILTRNEFDWKYPDNENFLRYSTGKGTHAYLESENSLIRVCASQRLGLWKGIELGKDSLSKFREIIKECNGNLICVDEIDKHLGIYEEVYAIVEEFANKLERRSTLAY